MSEVSRGDQPNTEANAQSNTSADEQPRHAHFDPKTNESESPSFQSDPAISPSEPLSKRSFQGRRSSHHVDRTERPVYYDSRAATKMEFKRRASTLQDYYKQNPTLLPQLPFTWRHGWRRWKLFILIFVMFVDACAIPIILYYTMTFLGHVQGYIVFAIVATIWGGPTYFEFALRTWRLIKKENFYRPLGTNSRLAFDITHWIFTLTIGTVTALLVIGSAPHIVFIRILSLPGPAIFFCLGGSIFALTFYNVIGRRAPFRISSTPKGGEVRPGVYYLIEDIVSVNANAGRPYREALEARYVASFRFRKMLRDISLFWSIPSLIISTACIIVVCIHEVPKRIAYGIGWGVPFLFAVIWSAITVPWIRRQMHIETVMWDMDRKGPPSFKNRLHNEKAPDA